VPMQEMLGDRELRRRHRQRARTRAKDALLTMELAKEEGVGDVSQDLRDLEGLTPDLITARRRRYSHPRRSRRPRGRE